MAIQIYGGGGGAAAALTSHTPDGDTLSHWDFGTDLTDDTGTADYAGTYLATTQDGNDGALLTGQSTFIKTAPGAAYTTGLYGAMSFGMLFRLDHLPPSYCALFACFNAGGGSGSANNHIFNLRVKADGYLQWIQEYGSKVASNHNYTLAVPVGEWCWIGGSRSSDGTLVTLAVNSDEEVSPALTQGDGGANSDLHICTGWDGRVLTGAVKSVILKDVASDLTTLRAETGL